MNHHSAFEIELTCGTEVEPIPIQWLWEGWLAAGKFHLLVGAPSTGKTTIALNLAAAVTYGGPWPDGSRSEAGNVLIWSGEDHPTDTLLPRLLAHNADRSRLYFVTGVKGKKQSRVFDPSRDWIRLCERACRIGDVRLIIVDPIVNAVSGDSHKNGEVRRDLQPLVELGAQLKTVVLGISHFSKGTLGCDPVERVAGSIAFGALARVVLATVHVTDEQGNSKRLLVRVKSNYGPNGGGYGYQIEQLELVQYPGLYASQIVWGERIEGSAQALLGDSGTRDDRSVLTEAAEFLHSLLLEGSVAKKEIDEKATDAGFSGMTLRRAKKLLGVEAVHERHGASSIWKWRLPIKVLNDPKPLKEMG